MTRQLLGHAIDLHDSEWISYDLNLTGSERHMKIDWVIPGPGGQNHLRVVVFLSGITTIDIPPSWESVYRWTFDILDSGLYCLRMTENHEGRAIDILFAEIKELSVELISHSKFSSLKQDRYAPRGRLTFENTA